MNGWTENERERRDLVEQGRSVVVNQRADERLIRWAQSEGKLVRVDRPSAWGNPFLLRADGTRDDVCNAFAIYLEMKPSLLNKIGELRGKALACWCYPERCHGDHLAELANQKCRELELKAAP